VIHAAGPKLLADLLSGSQSKIRDRKPQAPVEAKYVLRLEITVIDAQRMAVVDRIEELEKNVFDEVVPAKITSLLQNLAKQITIWAVIHNDEGAIFLFDDTMKRDYIRVD
jgi:hypothetical protein